MTRLSTKIDDKIYDALEVLAKRECRDVRQQAAVIIRDELTRRGLLSADALPVNIHPTQTVERMTA